MGPVQKNQSTSAGNPARVERTNEESPLAQYQEGFLAPSQRSVVLALVGFCQQ